MTEILFVIVRNPGGKKTPQDSITYYPNVRRIEEIEGLLESATVHQSQSALRDLVCFYRPLTTIDLTQSIVGRASRRDPLPSHGFPVCW